MPTIDFANARCKSLQELVPVTQTDLAAIVENLEKNPEIQLLDYIDDLGLTKEFTQKIRVRQAGLIPVARERYFERYRKAILGLRTVEQNLSIARLNPFTRFETTPPLFFGMGGGSKSLCKGLPFDVLGMLLTGEKMRRSLGLGKCRILLANRITYTNIPKNPEFSEAAIDDVMRAERDLLRLVTEKFGFQDHWEIFLQTDLEEVIGTDVKNKYERLIEAADRIGFIGGHHYAIEMADIWSLVGQEGGGIKLGWFMRGLDRENGGYIMDEQPFHARFNLFMAALGTRNDVTLAYANAGARLRPGPTGELEKESPYICYQPENRLLLSPFERPVEKLRDATADGGGFQFKYYRNLMSGIVNLFEELVLGKDPEGRTLRIPTGNALPDFRGNRTAQAAQFILDYVFTGRQEWAQTTWRQAFPMAKQR